MPRDSSTSKLVPGSYRYYVSQAGGRTAALSVTIPANQSVPLQLPAMEKETAVLAGANDALRGERDGKGDAHELCP